MPKYIEIFLFEKERLEVEAVPDPNTETDREPQSQSVRTRTVIEVRDGLGGPAGPGKTCKALNQVKPSPILSLRIDQRTGGV